jgi:hypothetical protein
VGGDEVGELLNILTRIITNNPTPSRIARRRLAPRGCETMTAAVIEVRISRRQ